MTNTTAAMTRTTQEDTLLTVRDVALLLDFTPATVQRWCRERAENRFPAITVGREYRIPRRQLWSWLLDRAEVDG